MAGVSLFDFPPVLRQLLIRTRLTLSHSALLILLALVAGAGVVAAWRSTESMRVLFEEGAQPVEMLSKVNYLMQRNRVLLMDTLINPGAANVAKRLKEAQSNKDTLAQTLSAYSRIPRSPAMEQRYQVFLRAQVVYLTEGLDKAFAAQAQSDFDEAQFLYLNQISPLAPAFQRSLEDLITHEVANAEDTYRASQQQTQQTLWLMVGLALSGLLVGVVLSMAVSHSITRPLRQAGVFATQIASGDLATPMTGVEGRDELTALGGHLESMRQGLAQIVAKVRQGSEVIALSSSDISNGVAHLSDRTEQQAAHLQAVRSSLDDLVRHTAQHVASSQRAGVLTRQASALAASSGAAVQELVGRIESVDQQSRQIADITSVIDAIAFQTNILALNAAVEAARAGEQGRGFAVVAQEVRTLAQRSASAAAQIKTLVTDTVHSVNEVTAIANAAGHSVSDIVSQVQGMDKLFHELDQTGTAKSHQLEQVGAAVGDIDHATQQNAALVEENAASAVELKAQATALFALVGTFRLADFSAMPEPVGEPVASRRIG